MRCIRKVTDSIYWVGGNDRRLALFENLFPLPDGVSYNSYLIMDEKTALMDTVDFSVTRQFLENIQYVLKERPLDYLIVQHMEPDHCSNIEELMRRYPNMQVVVNQKTLQMIHQFFHVDSDDRFVLVQDMDELSLGQHRLTFVMAPMVHWPEVMVTYESTEQILFSADGFGTFGALCGNLFLDENPCSGDWVSESRRYYSNIVGKYGQPVQALLKKAQSLSIRTICPLHGPVLRGDFSEILDKYDHWSRYEPEEKGVVIIYASIYGNTENAANALAFALSEQGVKNLRLYDVSNTHISYLISEIFRASHIVMACPTYNGGIYPAMQNLLHDMKALNVSNRTFALIDNGTWAPTVLKQMEAALGELKNCSIIGPSLKIQSSLKNDREEELNALASNIADSVLSKN